MRPQKVHLIGQHPPTLQVHILGMIGRERNRQQLHSGLLRRPAALAVITGLASGHYIIPVISATLDKGSDMVAG
jgi:hypothetical protein